MAATAISVGMSLVISSWNPSTEVNNYAASIDSLEMTMAFGR